MSGERDLNKLLAHMSPLLTDAEYVFCSIADAEYGDYADLQPLATIRETEGLTMILPKANADRNGCTYDSVFNKITLNVHSSLDAVGLIAACSGKLTERGISANVVAGYYHDHIFVQREKAVSAIEALKELTT